jgi:pyruvate dehydrogenase E2 component (dihydrolipoamide acetyltransferase)
MPLPVTVPRLGWNMEEGTFVEWVKADGDPVRPGEVVFRLEGDKAVEEVESLDAGTLHIPADGPRPGARVRVGAVIGLLLQPGEAPPAAAPPPQPATKTEPAAGSERIPPADAPPGAAGPAPPPVTPRARRLAKRLGIDPAQVRGGGRNGRVREREVAAHAPSTEPSHGRIVPLTPVRRAIAARMVESLRTAAPVTLTSAVDVTNLVNLRGQYKAVAAGGPVPSYTDFIVKLTAVALQKHPPLAARWTDAGLVHADRIDIGIAVDTDAGLLVPVIRDVPALGLAAVAARARDLVERARRGSLTAGDLRGGCFTVTNLGAFGVDAFTPIINPPECAVLGVGRIARRPVMAGDRVLGREVVTLSLTFDHRVVDGAPAARFLQTLATCLENPAPWLTG